MMGAMLAAWSPSIWQPMAVEGGDCLGSESSDIGLCGKAQGGMKEV